MKIALGLVGILISIIIMFQSFAIAGLSGLVNDEATAGAGAIGVFTGFLMFVGAALSFSLLRAASIIYALAGLLALVGKADFPDLGIWSWVAFIFAVICFLVSRSNQKPKTQDELN